MTHSETFEYLYGNRVAIGAAVVTLTTAAIKTMPIPQSKYACWFYDWTHQLFNITNTRLNLAPTPTPPETAPIPKV